MLRWMSLILCLATVAPAWAQRRPVTRPALRSATRPATISKYIKSTPAQDAAEMVRVRKVSQEVQKALEVKFAEIGTPHFLIFTDWPGSGAQDFLRTNLEGAYGVVSRQFDIPTSENIFIGKLPVYMFDRFADFKKFAQEYDELNVNDAVQGYFAGRDDGGGHLAMWKPAPSKS